jgi:D-glucosaminate-6-phosphate ammonia-lyase
LHAELLAGEPRILINLREDGLLVNPYMLEDGEAAIIARRLAELMSDWPAREADPAPAAPAVDVTGTWAIHLRFTRGESRHSMTLEQEGARVTGTYRSQYSWGQIEGRVEGNRLDLRVALPYEASGTSYHYAGTVEGDTFSGTMPMGRMWQAEWTARRI